MRAALKIKTHGLSRPAVGHGLALLIAFLLLPAITPPASQANRSPLAGPVETTKARASEEHVDAQSAPGHHELVQGRPAGGGAALHRLHLKSGQYLHVTVTQKGVDVTVTLLAPDGRRLARVNRNNLMYGSERFSWVVERGGVYNLLVSPGDAPVVPGAYEVTVDELRAARAEDKVRSAAEKYSIAAERHYERGDLREALNGYARAMRLWLDTDDRLEQGITLNNIGKVHGEMGEMRTALDHYVRALKLFRSVDARFEEAAALDSLGLSHSFLGEAGIALDYYDQALRLRRAGGDRQGEAGTLNGIGAVYYTIGETQPALNSLYQALDISRDIRDRRTECYTLLQLGRVYKSLNEPQTALDFLEQALSRSREAEDRGHRSLSA